MDVLARLGGSALGLTASVKPIIAPLFLPTPSTVGDAAGNAATATGEQEAPRSDNGPDPKRPRPRPWPLREEPPLMSAPELAPRADGPRRVEPPATAEARSPAVSDLIAPAPHHAPPEPLVGRVSMRDPAPVRAPIPPAGATTEAAPRDRAAPAPRLDAAPIRGESVQLEPLVTPEPPDRQPLDGLASILNRLQSLRGSAPVPASARSPVVRVTIGRIEVRSGPAAAPEPAVDVVRPAAPAYAPSPRLTLEQYLSRNREGR